MKTAFIGAGAGCRAVLELFEQQRLSILDLEILAVVDIDTGAPGYRYAQQRGWRTSTSIEEALALPGLELVIELTGRDDVVRQIRRLLRPGVRLLDHVLARVFWDLDEVVQNLQTELEHKTVLERQAEAERARLQEIMDTLPDVVMVLDQDMRIARANRRFEEVTGQRREQARGKYCHDVFCKTTRITSDLDAECPFKEVMRTKAPVTDVFHDRGHGGREGHYQVTANPIFDEQGNVVRVVETSREITQQVQLERSTQETVRRIRQIVDAVHGIITIKDLEGYYQLVNPRAEQLFGMRQEQMVGKTDAELFDPHMAAAIQQADQLVLDRPRHHVCEEVFRIEAKDHVLVSERFPLTDFKGDMVAICCVSRDVTRQRELQQELLQSERLAAVGKLAAGVAHELNNPLTGVLTFAEDLLHEAGPDDPRREDYEVIVNETIRCRRIVRDLLDFSRQQSPRRQRQDINPVIERTVAMIERQASFHDVDMVLELSRGMPEVDIDAGQIQQAILNLIINARDAMNAKGRLTIESGADDAGSSVVVAVTDTGCGIPEEQQRQVFEPFFSTKGDQGNGLGLPAVVGVMEQHGGKVDLDSTVGVGSTFRLVFPVLTRTGGQQA